MVASRVHSLQRFSLLQNVQYIVKSRQMQAASKLRYRGRWVGWPVAAIKVKFAATGPQGFRPSHDNSLLTKDGRPDQQEKKVCGRWCFLLRTHRGKL